MDVLTQNLSSDHDSPESARQQTDVEESSAAHAEDDGCKRVEDEQQQSVADNVSDDLSIPLCFLDRMAVEYGSLHAVDEHAPECELADDFVHGSLRDQELLECVAEAIESLSEQTEKISFKSVRRSL
jgi:hypothetical protein